MTTKPSLCTRCGDLINWMPCPQLPTGASSAYWEGWYHLDPTKEHFGPVGWRGITLSDNLQ